MPGVIRVVVGVAAGLAAAWLALLVGLGVATWRGRVDRATLRAGVSLVPDTVVLVRRLAGDRTLGWGVCARLVALLAYLACPIDLVPDVIPVLGYADDVVVVGLVLRSVVRAAGPAAVHAAWPGSPDGLRLLRRLCHLDPSP